MKLLFIILGSLSVALGVIGIFVPILPTTPFLLLAATLFMHSSPKLYDHLLSNKYLGEYIRNYREKRGLPIRIKVTIITTLWLTMATSIFIVAHDRPYIQIPLLMIAIGVTYHILTIKTIK